MMWSLLFISLLCNKQNNNFYTRKTNIIDANMNYAEYLKKPTQYSAGFDMRFKHSSIVSIQERKELEKIHMNFEKQKIVLLLQDEHIDIYKKIELIKNYDIIDDDQMDVNILRGNLLDDWEFNI